MLYCEECERLTNQTRSACPQCKGPLRTVNSNDSVLLIQLDSLHAPLIASLLREQGILFLQAGKVGAGLLLYGGAFLEEYRFLVPFDLYDQARALLLDVFGQDPDIVCALALPY